MVFLPRNPTKRRRLEERFEQIVQSEGQTVLGWRTVPTNNSMLGETAQASEPFMRQVFIGRNPAITDEMAFERKLYVIRKRAYSEIRTSTIDGAEYWYMPQPVVQDHRLQGHAADRAARAVLPGPAASGDGDGARAGALALQHEHVPELGSRASVSLHRAQRRDQHAARQHQLDARARGAVRVRRCSARTSKKILPIINPNGSDSAMFDNTLELLVLAGRSLPHAMMMMIPEPWSNHESMDDDKRAFYQYHSSLMEPWDGPASIAFTDGKHDRRGARSQRPASVALLRDEGRPGDHGLRGRRARHCRRKSVLHKGRLQPGRMFLVDTEQGRIIDDEEIKRTVAERAAVSPVARRVSGAPRRICRRRPEVPAPDPDTLLQRQIAFGYTFEDQRMLLAPMAQDGVEAVGSMGNDTPLAVLSDKPRLLYDYFKQLFAQVTNPPIDCIREELITASEVWLGSEGNLLRPAAGRLPPARAQGPDPHERGVREGAAHERAGPAGRRAVRSSSAPTRGEKGLAKSMEELCLDGAAHDRGRGSQRPHPQRSRREPRVRADAGAAGGGRAASLPDPRRPAHARRASCSRPARRARCITSRC